MLQPPQTAQSIFTAFQPAFTRPTAARMSAVALIAIITLGRRTLTAILITAAGLLTGHYSIYYRLFSRPAWSTWRVARILATLVIEAAPPGEPIVLLVDDTTTEHPGKNVYGKGKHRDAKRSSKTLTKWIWGHKWVALAVALPIPFVHRPWAVTLMTALYRSPGQNEKEGRRHRTPSELARILVRRLVLWFPERQFILVGDGGFSSHEMARFAQRYRKRLTFIGRFYADANLVDPPPPYSGKGRPRVKGARRPSPQEVVAQTRRRQRATVDWYGGDSRQVSLVGKTDPWFKAGCGLVTVRWVHVLDLEGTHREEYFFSTDTSLSLEQIVSLYTRRWNIETLFQEIREHLGLGTTRRRCRKAVLRTEPWLFGLHTVIVLIYVKHLKTNSPRILRWPWHRKSEPTLSNAMATVRGLIWVETIFPTLQIDEHVKKLPTKTQQILLNWLTQAA